MTNQEYADGLRAIANWVEAHPEVALIPGDYFIACEDTKENAAVAARALGSCRKDITESTFTLRREFGALTVGLVFWRSSVCERRVVGHKDIPERVVPAHVEEIVEWDCSEPILATVATPAPDHEEIPF